MTGIFSKPKTIQQENRYGIKVLFLHGLEGRGPSGTKARSLSEEWAALCPTLRTLELANLRRKCSGHWSSLARSEIEDAFEVPYSDARDAVSYAEPDLIVGSSLGGAILFRLISENQYSGRAVFCAPAIQSLLAPSYISETIKKSSESFKDSVWLLGETDTIVSNRYCIQLAKDLGGSIIVSPNDGHRLNKAVESNILNTAVLTSLEISS